MCRIMGAERFARTPREIPAHTIHRSLVAATVVGPAVHTRAVDTVRASYRAIPAGATVRLAKRTSNLFRPRDTTHTGLDVSSLDGVIAVDLEALTADVQGACAPTSGWSR